MFPGSRASDKCLSVDSLFQKLQGTKNVDQEELNKERTRFFSYQVSLLRTMKCVCFCSPRKQKGKVFSMYFQMPLVKGEPMRINSITFPMHMHEC